MQTCCCILDLVVQSDIKIILLSSPDDNQFRVSSNDLTSDSDGEGIPLKHEVTAEIKLPFESLQAATPRLKQAC
ncbi:hypothetical protein AAZX31_12G197400 [Glycine max]|nr:hypothetical protein GYH30_034431 [Glycine max]KRH27225.2 hypothetical protein GLYMA_12G208850v4 [Glycine max]